MRRLKNLTITVEPGVLKRVRIKAAEKQKSVARFVGELLREEVMADAQYDRAMNAFFAVPRRPMRWNGRFSKRGELYDRPGFRRHQRSALRSGRR